MGRENVIELIESVVGEGVCEPSKRPWHAAGLEPRQEMAGERQGAGAVGTRLHIGKVRREIPVVPAVVAADRHVVAAGEGPRRPHRHGHCLTTGSGESGHRRPGVNRDEFLGELHLIEGLQRAHRARLHAADHRGIHVRIGVAQNAGEDAAGRHVDELPPLGVDHLAAAGLLVVGRPLVGRKKLRPLGEQLGATGEDGLCLAILCLHVDRGPRWWHAQHLSGRTSKDQLDVAVVGVHRQAGLPQRKEIFDAHEHRLGERLFRPVDLCVVRPEKAVAETHAAAADRADRVIQAEQEPGGAKFPQDRLVGSRLTIGRVVEEDVVEAAQRVDPLDGVPRIEAPRAVGEHKFCVRVAQALFPDVPLVRRVGESQWFHHVEHDRQAAGVGEFPDPFRDEVLAVGVKRTGKGRLARGPPGEDVIDLEASPEIGIGVELPLDRGRIVVRGGQQKTSGAGVAP